jgi:hypothetical protein
MSELPIPRSLKPLAVDYRGGAELVGLKSSTLRLYVRLGWLKAVRCGTRVLLPVSELERLVREGVPSRPRRAANSETTTKQQPRQAGQHCL